jgi:hypothetical protein
MVVLTAYHDGQFWKGVAEHLLLLAKKKEKYRGR